MKKLPVLLFLIASLTVFSQSNSYENTNIPFIDVTGTSIKEVVPNEIYIQFSMKDYIERGNKVSIKKQEDKLIEALNSIGIASENLTVSDMNSVILKTGWWRKDIMAKAEYTLKITGSSKLKKVFEMFDALKIKKANIVKVDHSEIEELTKENRIVAIKAAKEKADYLLNAINQKTGKAVVVNEFENFNSVQNFHTANNINTSYSSAKLRQEKNIEFEKIKIVSKVYVKFQIK